MGFEVEIAFPKKIRENDDSLIKPSGSDQNTGIILKFRVGKRRDLRISSLSSLQQLVSAAPFFFGFRQGHEEHVTFMKCQDLVYTDSQTERGGDVRKSLISSLSSSVRCEEVRISQSEERVRDGTSSSISNE